MKLNSFIGPDNKGIHKIINKNEEISQKRNDLLESIQDPDGLDDWKEFYRSPEAVQQIRNLLENDGDIIAGIERTLAGVTLENLSHRDGYIKIKNDNRRVPGGTRSHLNSTALRVTNEKIPGVTVYDIAKIIVKAAKIESPKEVLLGKIETLSEDAKRMLCEVVRTQFEADIRNVSHQLKQEDRQLDDKFREINNEFKEAGRNYSQE